jgi:eukaryotic-like serine/threonine-protein kinase
VVADFANSTDAAVFDDTLKTALTVALNQSPFLNVLSDNKVTTTLTLMTRPAGTKLTLEVARDICQRAGGKAYIAGSVGSLGSEYVLGLKAVNCQGGDTLAQELQRFDEARQTIRDAQVRKLDDYLLRNALYALAFLATDSPAMMEKAAVVREQSRG